MVASASKAQLHIVKALAIGTCGGYFNEDLEAIRGGAARDGFFFLGEPVTPGFATIKEPSEAVSIVFALDNGQCVVGDALSVEFATAGGRQGRFRSEEQVPLLQSLCDHFSGMPVSSFLAMSDNLEEQPFPRGVHRAAAQYGISQALLQAVATQQGRTPAETLAQEIGTELPTTPVPVYVQTGEQRHSNVDKAILKAADVLPHGLINDIENTFGRDGSTFAEYVSWVVDRVRKYGHEGFQPELHFDVYGLPGLVFDFNIDRIADYLSDIGRRALPYRLCIEMPLEMTSRDAQIEAFISLRSALQRRESEIALIVDEWANDLDDIRAFVHAGATDMINVKTPDLGSIANAARAVLECWKGGVRPILGGSCTDTDQSARIIAHVALACSPAWVLARPGMGVDEGFQIVRNEMLRTLAIARARAQGSLP
jgi:methylaspartate ammonia-lyase